METVEKTKKRRSRLAISSPKADGAIQPRYLQERDKEILRLLGSYRAVETDDLIAYCAARGWGAEGTRKRISRLKKGYIQALDQVSNEERRIPGNKHDKLALQDFGAEIYYDLIGESAPNSIWRDKNRNLQHETVKHRLLVSKTMIAFEIAAVLSGERFRIMHPYELLRSAPKELLLKENPFVWTVEAEWRGKKREISGAADYTFAIELSDKRRALFFLEADNRSESNIPRTERSFQKATIFKKNLGYGQLFNEKDHPNRLGMKKGFTVFWVTSGKEQKVANIAKTIRAATDDQLNYAFLTTCDDHIRASNNIHAVPWIAANGKETKFEI